MKLELRKYAAPVNESLLARLLEGTMSAESETLRCGADFSRITDLVTRMSEDSGTERSRAAWDSRLVGPLHSALEHIPRSTASDLRFWQWLAISNLPDLVWFRWLGYVPESLDEALESSSIRMRFLGNPSGRTTLNSISRHVLARLWWCGEILGDENDYEFARKALATQDLYQAIFERRFGLYPPAARACVAYYGQASETAFRAGTKRLNQILTTIVLEALDENEIMELLKAGS